MSEFMILGEEDYVPFITNIKVEELGQNVTIDCCSDDIDDNLTYRVLCLRCEKVELTFQKKLKNCISNDRSIEVVEFSTGKESNGKKYIYLYARVVKLELVCEIIKLEKDW